MSHAFAMQTIIVHSLHVYCVHVHVSADTCMILCPCTFFMGDTVCVHVA